MSIINSRNISLTKVQAVKKVVQIWNLHQQGMYLYVLEEQ